MPYAAMKPCSYPGCPTLVRKGRCTAHQQVQAQSFVRNPEWQRLYNTKRWALMRKAQLSRDPWCADCLAKGIYTQATDVDHIEPHRGDAHRFFASSLQSLCHSCHSAKTANEVNGRAPQNVSDWGAASVRGQQREKNSQCGESGQSTGGANAS